MYPEKTVFIVGAGASNEVGLPIGNGLVEKIAKKLDYKIVQGSLRSDLGDEDILDVVQQYASDRPAIDSYLAAALRISKGVDYSNSIDTFLDAHRDDAKIQKLGKLAIAKTILEEEQKSSLYIERDGSDFRDVDRVRRAGSCDFSKVWPTGLGEMEISRIFERVSFVVFNYDRCIEHFLYHALRNLYGIDNREACDVLKRLVILHAYGSIADLPWQSSKGIPFGFRANRSNLEMMSARIKTFTELEEGEIHRQIKEEVSAGEALVFLGFSYHALNMLLLDSGNECELRSIFGTAVGMSESNVEDIKKRLRALIGRSLIERILLDNTIKDSERLYLRPDLVCSRLLEEYSRNLFLPGRRSPL